MLEIKDISDRKLYAQNPISFFKDMPDLATPLLGDIGKDFRKIEDLLYKTPSLINIISQYDSVDRLEAVLTKDQVRKLAKGSLNLLSQKDGSLMAALIDPESKKIVANLPLKMVKENHGKVNLTGKKSRFVHANRESRASHALPGGRALRKGCN